MLLTVDFDVVDGARDDDFDGHQRLGDGDDGAIFVLDLNRLHGRVGRNVFRVRHVRVRVGVL